MTSKDIEGPNLAAVFESYDRPVLVEEGGKVEFLADALAIVVAKDEETAEKAIEKIIVEYDSLPGIFTLEESMDKNEPCFVSEIKKGDLGEGFEKASVIVENECVFPYVEHSYIEPEAGYSFIDSQGVINVCYGSQNLSRHHRMVCKALDLPFHKVRLYSPYIGGAFGGKHSNSVQVYLALLAHVVKKPVKMVWTREEAFFPGCKGHKLKTKAKMGLNEDGKIVALDVEILSESYIGYAEKTMAFATRYAFGPYWIDNMNIQGKIYKTNNAEVGAFRGFGASESAFMIETLIEKAAKKMNIGLEHIRKINIIKESQLESHFPGAPWKLLSENISIEETLNKALEVMGPKPKAEKGKKMGSCISCFKCGENKGLCILEDDFEDLRQLWIESDVIIYSTPVYHLSVPAQLKCFIDRLGNSFYGHYKVASVRHMKTIGVLCQGMHFFGGQELATSYLIQHA
ncbi:MAG: molybdopterin-dependent oxidoreductase, partial [Lutispora sp.]|nr:molybdopterin-dependent oxidoreductase [Lutispora sp.]